MANFLVTSVGADPEVFLRDPETKQPVASIGLIGGTKKKPIPMKNLPEGFMVQEDNVAAEYNIPPARREVDFSSAIAKGLSYVERLAKKHGLELMVESAAMFPMSELCKPGAMVMGCEPDFNAWTMEENPRPDAEGTHLRTAAGHIHIGLDNASQEMCALFARMFDLYLTVPSLLVSKKTPRRMLYGKAGAMRFKPYGLEQRTLDNFWLPVKEYRSHAYRQVGNIAELLSLDSGYWDAALQEYSDPIQTAINTHDRDIALRLMHTFNIPAWE